SSPTSGHGLTNSSQNKKRISSCRRHPSRHLTLLPLSAKSMSPLATAVRR
ncbi:Uncharacterized protein APZ42_007690, partial [Daphnia magna]